MLSKLYEYVDADGDGDTKHRKSISGMATFLDGDPIAYTSKVQPTIAFVSIKSKFIAASDKGKMALYLRVYMVFSTVLV